MPGKRRSESTEETLQEIADYLTAHGEGCTVRQIAEALGLTERAVRNRLHRLRAQGSAYHAPAEPGRPWGGFRWFFHAPDTPLPDIPERVPLVEALADYLRQHPHGRTAAQISADLEVSQAQLSQKLRALESQGRALRARLQDVNSRADLWFPCPAPAPDPRGLGDRRLQDLVAAAERNAWVRPGCRLPGLGAGTCYDSGQAADKRRREAVAALECVILALRFHQPGEELCARTMASVLVSTIGSVLANQIADALTEWAAELTPQGGKAVQEVQKLDAGVVLRWAAHRVRGLGPVLDTRS